MTNLVSRTNNLLQNKAFTDVTFIVGPPSQSKKYVGHRVLLAMTSPVFESLFYSDSCPKVVRVPDVAPIAFENLLRYAYTDSLNLTSVEDAMLTASAAKKYLLPHLLQECLNYVDRHVGPSSACQVLEFSSVLESPQLFFQALQVLDRQTFQVLSHKSLNGIQASTLALLVSRRHLNLYSEASLVTAALSWAGSEARRRALDSNDYRVLRRLLEEAGVLSHLRFLALSNEEFARIVVSSSTPDGSLLTEQEQVAVFLNLAVPGLRPMNGLSQEIRPRSSPPDFFLLKRGLKTTAVATSMASSCKPVRTIGCRFSVKESDVFIIGLVLPIKLDSAFFSTKSARLELQMKEEVLACVLSKDKECSVRFKRPLLAKKGSVTDITLRVTSEDLVVVKQKSAQSMMEIEDNEGLHWLFFKNSCSLETNDMMYYY